MSLTITLRPEFEEQLREDAARAGLPPEELAARRLEEAELIFRIEHAFTPEQTRELYLLDAKRRDDRLTEAERVRLHALLHEREASNVRRVERLVELARLRGVTLPEVMAQLQIRTPEPR